MPTHMEVLIVSYDSADVIERCLASLATVAPSVPVAIREHGAAAPDRLLALAGRYPADVRVEHDPSNPGFGVGCNRLAAGSHATWLMFLNPDTETLSWPWGEHTPSPRSLTGASMVDSGPEGDHSGRSYRLRDEVRRSWFRERGAPPDGTGFVSGAALLISAEAFAELDGFDERYFMFYEDIDLCLRANALEMTTTIAPEWRVHHSRGHSTSTRFGLELQRSYQSGLVFHSDRGTRPATYRSYVVADALLRLGHAALTRNQRRREAYWQLARHAASDLVHRRPVPPR